MGPFTVSIGRSTARGGDERTVGLGEANVTDACPYKGKRRGEDDESEKAEVGIDLSSEEG